MLKHTTILLFSLFLLGACGLTTTRPKLEMSLAQEAFLAARDSDAQIHASSLYRRAEEYYLRAKSAYRRKYFNQAKQYAILSKEYSERAEMTAERKKTLDY